MSQGMSFGELMNGSSISSTTLSLAIPPPCYYHHQTPPHFCPAPPICFHPPPPPQYSWLNPCHLWGSTHQHCVQSSIIYGQIAAVVICCFKGQFIIVGLHPVVVIRVRYAGFGLD